MYRLATKPCDCGSGITPCKSPAHIAALDGMSAVCEAQKAYAKAIQYASLLLAISPHAPEGYLRIVKNLRLQARASKADATSQCMYILTQAAASVRTFGDKYHDKLKVRPSCRPISWSWFVTSELTRTTTGHQANASNRPIATLSSRGSADGSRVSIIC